MSNSFDGLIDISLFDWILCISVDIVGLMALLQSEFIRFNWKLSVIFPFYLSENDELRASFNLKPYCAYLECVRICENASHFNDISSVFAHNFKDQSINRKTSLPP